MVFGGLARLGMGLALTVPGRVLGGARGTVRTTVDVASEVATLGVGVAATGARASVGAARLAAGVARRAVAGGAQHWQQGRRLHLPLRGVGVGMSRGSQQAIKKVVTGVVEHPDVLVAYWDGGLRQLVVQVTENAVTDRVAQSVTAVAAKHGLVTSTQDVEQVSHPGDVGEVRTAAAALALDAAAVAGALTAQVLRLRRSPQAVTAVFALVREDPRMRSLLRLRCGKTTAELVMAAANAAVYGMGQSPTELVLDAAMRTGQLVDAVARVAVFDATHDELCVPERASVQATAPVRRAAPSDPVQDYAVQATTASVVGAAATLLWKGNLQEASAAALAGSPRPARYGWAAYQAGLGCALASEGVVVRDGERLRLLPVIDTVVVHAGALEATERTVVEAYPSAAGWDQGRLWQAAQWALSTTTPSDTELCLRPVADNSDPDTGLMIASVADHEVGTVLVHYEVDPLAQAVVDAARQAGLRVVVVGDGAVCDHRELADEIVGERDMAQVVSALQDDGHVVLTIARLRRKKPGMGGPRAVIEPDEVAGLLRGDLAVTLADQGSTVVWAADLVCARGLPGVWRLLRAVPAARKAAQHARVYAQAGAALSGLLVATGPRRRWEGLVSPLARVGPVNVAAAAALVSGWWFAVGVATTATPAPRPRVAWHALTPQQVLRLTTTLRRVSAARPALADHTRQLLHAMAGLPGAAPIKLSLRLADAVRAELNDPLTPILAVGAAASAIVGSSVDAVLVLGAMGINAVVGGVQRVRAERALASLIAAHKPKARRVLHAANTTLGSPTVLIDAAQLARGDVIELGVGDVVPADARLLELCDLEMDESALTGESLPATKQIGASPAASLGDRRCMVFEGTTVVAGQARAVVVDTGAHTEASRAVTLASRTPPAGGVQARLRELTSKALPLTLVGGAAVTGLSLLRGRPIRQAIGGGVAVAVAAVPEGLPLVATVAQMAAARRLSRRGVLVRTPRSLEALGRVDTVCFDKTGTLTRNQLRVVQVATADGSVHSPTETDAHPVLRAAARACPPEEHEPGKHSHATDEAVLTAAPSDPDWHQLAGQPFETTRGYAAATGTAHNTTTLLAVKGAPEVVLPCCPDIEPHLVTRADTLAAEGLRVLAVAQRRLDPSQASEALDKPLSELEFLGFVALADTPRASAAPLVTSLHNRGITPIMLTGDHPRTALAIATTLGWPHDTHVVTGQQLANLDRADRARLLQDAAVVARVTPEQKLYVIEALRAAGRVVAMVGDGANDAAAIRAADVGIGLAARGSAAARNAADLVLTNDDLAVLADAITEGRALWRSVADAISILLGGNAGEVGFTVLGTLLSGATPLSTRQLLLVNLLTDMFPAMAIAVTPTDDHQACDHISANTGPVGTAVLQAPLTQQISHRGVLTGLGATTAWLIGTLTPGTARRTSTMALCGLVATQLAQTLTRRHHSPLVLATSLGSAATLFAIVQTPGLSHFFGCTPLGPIAWTGVSAAVAATTVGPRLLPTFDQHITTLEPRNHSPEDQ